MMRIISDSHHMIKWGGLLYTSIFIESKSKDSMKTLCVLCVSVVIIYSGIED